MSNNTAFADHSLTIECHGLHKPVVTEDDSPFVREPAVAGVGNCWIGSCRRHQKCMYSPCRHNVLGAARDRLRKLCVGVGTDGGTCAQCGGAWGGKLRNQEETHEQDCLIVLLDEVI